jgi:16S rRNA (uracil1498-N3)-methyltransferase
MSGDSWCFFIGEPKETRHLKKMLNAFCSQIPTEKGSLITLDPSESFHLIKVRRARIDEPVCVYDGKGHRCYGRVSQANPKSAGITIDRTEKIPETIPQFTLAQVMPKGKSMDLVVQKATELGVHIIQPLTSENCEMSLPAEKAEKKRQKWQSIALESVKQCGNPFLPKIQPLISFKEYLDTQTEKNHLKIIAALLPETQTPRKLVTTHKNITQCSILIGPEGDFSPSEYEHALSKSFLPVTLGPLVLRAETAGLAALSILGNEFRELTD